ncbi:multicomponent K+:H+ antiporter subunit E [Erythromicrobium ramosum]|uniref:Multicomponent K+:H+ antiporter subunit E n=1 Tax=Erythrobacter ramosus TaxID=35811 RepID=A0A6I4UEV8_9SPHN|nr:Na+/H+ antiporter subunit E [Erythrobacter ramosus]MBB3774929.1 multicomponent K+:H+ antiporter subunit E [Erythrobacter ramosus]MXP37430.1 Na+/H+ antiporter subunit E [Erythrobacter ramosus]
MTNRLLPHPGLSLLLVVMWVVMVSDLTFGTLFLGIVFGILVPIFTAPWWPERPPVRLVPALGYLGIVLWDIVVANFHVAAIILFKPNRDLKPAWLTIPLDLSSPEAITVFAGTISLTPGTVSSDISACGQYLLVHALHAPDPAGEITKVKARYEARLKEIFR